MKEEKEVLINSLLLDELDKMNHKKRITGFFEELYKESLITRSRVDRLKECLTYRVFAANSDYTKKKELVGYACEDRFCPVCQQREAYSRFKALHTAMSLYLSNKGLAVSFLTLTVVNCNADSLDDTITALNDGLKKLFKRKLFYGWIDSFIVKLEVTYNNKVDSYHPHLHLILLTKKGFFIDEKALIKDWNDCFYNSLFLINNKKRKKKLKKTKRNVFGKKITQVCFQRVDEHNLEKSLLELAKYSVKSSDYAYNLEVFRTFFGVISSKKLFRVNGPLKEFYLLIKTLSNNPTLKSFFRFVISTDKEKVFYSELFSAFYNYKEKSFSLSELTDKDDGFSLYKQKLDDLNNTEKDSFETFVIEVKKEKEKANFLINQLEEEKKINKDYSDDSSFIKKQKKLLKRVDYLERLDKLLQELEKKQDNNN